jgi:quercetin 2,3-dioxygenase
MIKKLKSTHKLQFKKAFDGLDSIDTFHTQYEYDPYLVFTEFHMKQAVFGPHPHAGISVATYILPASKGSFLNRDSNGDNSIISPGSIHVTQAGSGIHHDEVPTVPGIDCHGFQIWINHSEANRMVEPKGLHTDVKDLSIYKDETTTIKVLLGKYNDVNSKITLVTPVDLWDVEIKANSTITLPAQEMSFIYMLSGSLEIEGKHIEGSGIILFEKKGDTIEINTASGVNFLFAAGQPIGEPIVTGGPFVMTTQEQMHETRLRLGKGLMGHLESL